MPRRMLVGVAGAADLLEVRMTSIPARVFGPAVTAPHVYYFGCGNQLGHYWHAPPKEGREWQSSSAVADVMRTVFPRIDGQFAPLDCPQVEGEAKLTYANGWTVLAWWDNSIDPRGNSNSAIVVDAERDFDQMVALLAIHFPDVSKRQRAPIKFVQLEAHA